MHFVNNSLGFVVFMKLWFGTLQDTVKTAGAEVSGEGVIETFHNDDEALDAVENGVVVRF